MSKPKRETTTKLLRQIRKCDICAPHLPLGPNPVCSFSSNSKILLVGQAPGVRVHESGIPWNDPSGERLREWLRVDEEEFYNPDNFAIVPMGFCYPGKGKSGDLPPRPECAEAWMEKILSQLTQRKLTILIGQYAQKYFLGDKLEKNLTSTVKNWKNYAPDHIVLPHPSPRNNIWLKKNPWFERDVLPHLRRRINAMVRK